MNVVDNLVDKLCAQKSFRTLLCSICKTQLNIHSIRCQTCNLMYCGSCDHLVHSKQPLHDRWKTEKGKWTSLLPEEFVSFPEGTVFSESIITIDERTKGYIAYYPFKFGIQMSPFQYIVRIGVNPAQKTTLSFYYLVLVT